MRIGVNVPLSAYDGYLFDLDGTLVDTAPDISAALNHALHRHGYSGFDEALARHWVGHGARMLIKQALQNQRPPDADTDSNSETITEALLADFIGYYEEHIADFSKPYPAVIDTLTQLNKRGAKLAIVTNKLTTLSKQVLDALELTRYFQSIVCGDSTDNPKPAADPALLACRELSLPVTRVLFVGDSATDVDCARAAGCDVVCVPDGYNHGIAASELGADAVIESLQDLV